MLTTHERAIQLFQTKVTLYGKRWKVGSKARRQAMREAAREAVAEMGKRETVDLSRDYRPNIGSGRSADWLDIGFEHYQVEARALHKGLGLSGEELRKAVRVIHSRGNTGYDLSDVPHVPGTALDGLVGRIRSFGLYVSRKYGYPTNRTITWAEGPFSGQAKRTSAQALDVLVWMAIVEHLVEPAIAEYDAKQTLKRINENPEAKISGYLASSIMSWSKGESGYEDCSGCDSFRWFKERPEFWDLLMSRAPIGNKGGSWEQVFPHEHERRENLMARGWFETMRLNDSLFTLKRPGPPCYGAPTRL